MKLLFCTVVLLLPLQALSRTSDAEANEVGGTCSGPGNLRCAWDDDAAEDERNSLRNLVEGGDEIDDFVVDADDSYDDLWFWRSALHGDGRRRRRSLSTNDEEELLSDGVDVAPPYRLSMLAPKVWGSVRRLLQAEAKDFVASVTSDSDRQQNSMFKPRLWPRRRLALDVKDVDTAVDTLVNQPHSNRPLNVEEMTSDQVDDARLDALYRIVIAVSDLIRLMDDDAREEFINMVLDLAMNYGLFSLDDDGADASSSYTDVDSEGRGEAEPCPPCPANVDIAEEGVK